jgi:hypothetical protein
MTITQTASELRGDTRLRIESEFDKEQTGRAWAFDGTVDELLTAETEAAFKGRGYGGYQVRDFRYNEQKECFVFVID